jgi:ubiquinone/menaquinone biosynthesis C-methylase UbiE
MAIGERILMRMFGRPEGVLGRLGGIILARTHRGFAQEVVAFLEIGASEKVLEVGFGPGIGIELLAKATHTGRVAGVDPSAEMVKQATARNAAAIRTGMVDLHRGTVASIPFQDNTFDTVIAINSMQVWPDATAGLREIRRVSAVGGRVALGFTPNSGQPRAGVTEMLSAAGFDEAHLAELRGGFCALARKG